MILQQGQRVSLQMQLVKYRYSSHVRNLGLKANGRRRSPRTYENCWSCAIACSLRSCAIACSLRGRTRRNEVVRTFCRCWQFLRLIVGRAATGSARVRAARTATVNTSVRAGRTAIVNASTRADELAISPKVLQRADATVTTTMHLSPRRPAYRAVHLIVTVSIGRERYDCSPSNPTEILHHAIA